MINASIKNYINKLNYILKRNTNYYFGELTHDLQIFLSLWVAKSMEKNIIIIMPTDSHAENLYSLGKTFYKDLNLNYFPSTGTDAYQHISPNQSVSISRINALSNLMLKGNKGPNVVVTSVLGFIQRTVGKQYLENYFFQVKKDSVLDSNALMDFLLKNNYQQVSLVMEEGQFAIRGDIIDICSPNVGAFRLDIFDDKVERIRAFDLYHQKTIADLETVIIQPSSEILLHDKMIENFKYNYQQVFGKRDAEMFELLENKILPKGIENYLPLFYDNTSTISDFVQDPSYIIFDNFKQDIKNAQESYQNSYDYRNSANQKFKESFLLLEPSKLILYNVEVNRLLQQPVITMSIFKQPEGEGIFNLSAKLIGPVFNPYKATEKFYVTSLFNFITDELAKNKSKKFIIFSNSEDFVKHLEDCFSENKLDFCIRKDEIGFNTSSITVVLDCKSNFYEHIKEGFILGNLTVMLDNEITGLKKTFKSRKRNPKKLLDHLSAIKVKDIVVHIKHGLGEYQGIKTLTVIGVQHDFLEILYYGDEKLYLPVENIDLINRYGASQDGVNLDKLGSNSFERKQTKVKEKIKDIAYDLIKIAAQRNAKKSIIIDINAEEYEKFCHSFPYVETQDQLNAINDIISDLTCGKPQDRLICGDVGFGKTEVAMRGAFIVANSGYQVAIITPTTLLCNQHFNNFIKRFKDFPIRISQLSRFVKAKDKKKIKQELQEGKIDIIIGTHSLLANDINFNKLGLIIIDEEQNFGVFHKEKLKTIKEEAHILTLSATPIPRTIQLAFKGIKDLSLITTPPIDKLAINTYILPFDLLAIKNAILKEKSREGQIYFVCQKISNISDITEVLEKLDINITYTVAHGQMPTEQLEQSMMDFQNKKYDILVSTNIIESGLDLGNVNTIIILRSDLFGLAQLYQLRGRVGRSDSQSYAYLLYDNDKQLTKKAEKRLQVLQNLDYLGASFALANYDLDLRGAGNLLGEEQSGHIKEIGSDLYQKLLEQEIWNIKENNSSEGEYYNFSPTINLNVPVLIPKKYIPDVETSIEIYQRIGKLVDYNEIIELKAEMQDRFGNLPYQVENLFLSIEVKLACKKAHIEKIVSGPKGILLNFYNNKFPNVEDLLIYIASKAGLLTVKPEGCIVINVVNPDPLKQIKEALKVLEEISKLI
ncbi:Transcription-repair-coupling factor [Candidatus Hepatincolaceae symbiont of Richtersius coronifer]